MLRFVGWPLGVLLGVSASILGFIGKILIKLSHIHDRQHLFILGMVLLMGFNPILSITSYHYAAQSTLAPLAGLAIVWNTVFSPRILVETISLSEVLGAACIFVGCVFVCISGSHEAKAIPIDRLASHFLSTSFLVYFILFILLSMALTKQCMHEKTRRLSLVTLSGIVAGQMYFITALMRIITDGAGIFRNPLTYLCFAGAAIMASMGLYLLNLAFSLYDGIFVLYVYESSYIVAGAISGVCFSNEDVAHSSPGRIVLYMSSLGLILVGIRIISKRSVPENVQKKPLLIDSEDYTVEV